MATLVLTAVGTVLGGPIGGAIGAIAGQAIDQQIFKPKGRQGPRLSDLRIQTSSYGAQIPKLFGTMRVAGTVVWATDLIEHRSKQGGGKGRPSTTVYSYSCSFAVLLSGRPIRRVGRIWADGNLLRGAAGDWKSETGFRLYTGGEDQTLDPAIASAEGLDGAPAFRGCAYAVFEAMALAPFGNRIPSLTFEVDAEDAPVGVSAILSELSDGAIEPGGGPALAGFAASGDSVAGLVSTLADALPLVLGDSGTALRLLQPSDPVMEIGAAEIDASGSEELGRLEAAPAEASIGYYEPDRDYQAGLQRVRRPGGAGEAIRVELPAALPAAEAKALATDLLARKARERGTRRLRCGWRRLDLKPGAMVQVEGEAGLWRVSGRTVDRDGVLLQLVRVALASAVVLPAEPGRGISGADVPHGPTVVHLLDLPNLADTAPDTPRLYIAAAGPSPGWRKASLLVSLDDGVSWDGIGGTAAPAVIGSALTALPAGSAALFDRADQVDVKLLNEAMQLADADDGRLQAGANLALLGNELIQFGHAEPLGSGVWRLSRLVRGRRGTEWATAAHAAGERFVLIEADALLAYDPPPSAAGATVRLMASSVGDAAPAEAQAANIGEALRPPAPAQLCARRRQEGGFDLGWVRRSRTGWRWTDGSDAPLGEEAEFYRVTFDRGDGSRREVTCREPRLLYAGADLAEDAGLGTEVTISVTQQGTHAVSRPATLTLTLP